MTGKPANLKIGQRIRDLRKSNGLLQQVLARMVGISAGALTNFEKGRRHISLDWLQKISDALNTPIAYFLPDERKRKRIRPGDPREIRLLSAWRRSGSNAALRNGFLQLMKDMAKSFAGKKSARHRPTVQRRRTRR